MRVFRRRWHPWHFYVAGAFISLTATLVSQVWVGSLEGQAADLQNQIDFIEQHMKYVGEKDVSASSEFQLAMLTLEIARVASPQAREGILKDFGQFAIGAVTEADIQMMWHGLVFEKQFSLVFDVLNGKHVSVDKLSNQFRDEWFRVGGDDMLRGAQMQDGDLVLRDRRQHVLDEEATVKNFAAFLQVLGIFIALAKDLVFPKT